MKIIGFKALKVKQKPKKHIILSFTNVFKKSMIIMSIALFFLVLNLVFNTLLVNVVASVEQYIETFVRYI